MFHEKGVRFCFTRYTRGTVVDDTSARYTIHPRRLGWVTGGYHFLDDTAPVLAQVSVFGLQIRTLEPDACVLDVEASGIAAHHVATFVAEFRRLFPHRKLGLYTRQGYLDARPWGDWITSLFDWVWLAQWDGSRHIDDWRRPNELDGQYVHQFGALKYEWNGKTRSVDGNVYAGTPLDLYRLVH
jgi:hypothetical protein